MNSATSALMAADQPFLPHALHRFQTPTLFCMQIFSPCACMCTQISTTGQDWTGIWTRRLCFANASQVCKLTFRADPKFARELTTLPPEVCTQTFNRPSQVCMQSFTPAYNSLHANFQSSLTSLHATSWRFACKLLLICVEWYEKVSWRAKESPKKNSFCYLLQY